MKQLNIFTKSVFFAALAVAVTPALADDDDRIYAQNHAQYITHQAAGNLCKTPKNPLNFCYQEFRGFFHVQLFLSHRPNPT